MGRIGDDDYGKKVTASLRNAGVNTDYLVVDPDTQTGLALMPIEPGTGRYVCYVAMGGNDRLCPEDVKKAMDAQAFDMVLMQLEMPLETIYGTIELAKERHIPVFLDAGPAIDISLERLKGLFIISPKPKPLALPGSVRTQMQTLSRLPGCFMKRLLPHM